MKFESVAAKVMSIAAALTLSPIVGLIVSLVWYKIGGLGGIGIAFFLGSAAALVLIAWKSGALFQHLLASIARRLPDSMRSSVVHGIAGAFLVGALMLSAILILGHMRPEGLEFIYILPSMGVVLIVGLGVGVVSGFLKRRSSD